MEYSLNRENRRYNNPSLIFAFPYDIAKEFPDGDYYKFAYNDDLNYELASFNEIYQQIKDDSLKAAMKAKAYRIIQYYGVPYLGTSLLKRKIFNEEEIKILLNIDYYISIIKSKIDNNTSEYYPVNLGNAYMYIDFCFVLKDDDWTLDNIVKLLKAFEGAPYFIKLLVDTIELAKKEQRHELYEKLLAYYKEQLPDYYKNYLAICKDPDYLLNKTNACLDEVELIGIDSRITIAPEVEADCHNSLDVDFWGQNDFSMSLHDKGITPLFSEHIDPTVVQGKEINCTPFHDTKEELARFKAVMDMYRDIGYYYDEEKHDASGQINLGLDYLDTKEAILYFYQIYANVEELLFYIINPVGQVMRQPLIQNSRFKPISERIGKKIIDENMTREEAINLFRTTLLNEQNMKELQGLYKKATVCLRGSNKYDLRFEFRIPNGGVNYQSYIDNIRLYGRIMEVAKTVADALLRGELNSEEERLLRLIYDLEDVPQPDDYLGGQNFIFDIRRQYLEEKLDLLMDLLFTDEKVKNIL